MNFVVDENVSLDLVRVFRERGHTAVAIAEIATRGLTDSEVWSMAKQTSAILITRDYHFTNPARYRPEEVGGIFFIRRGNLRAEEEVRLVVRFLDRHTFNVCSRKLVVLSNRGATIR